MGKNIPKITSAKDIQARANPQEPQLSAMLGGWMENSIDYAEGGHYFPGHALALHIWNP